MINEEKNIILNENIFNNSEIDILKEARLVIKSENSIDKSTIDVIDNAKRKVNSMIESGNYRKFNCSSDKKLVDKVLKNKKFLGIVASIIVGGAGNALDAHMQNKSYKKYSVSKSAVYGSAVMGGVAILISKFLSYELFESRGVTILNFYDKRSPYGNSCCYALVVRKRDDKLIMTRLKGLKGKKV